MILPFVLDTFFLAFFVTPLALFPICSCLYCDPIVSGFLFCCMGMMQMSVVTDSPVHSSNSDDFIAFLDAELGASSPESSPDKEAENEDELESVRCSS